MVTSSMHMLELPSVFVRPDLPNRTFLTIKGIGPQKTNGIQYFLRDKLEDFCPG